MDDLLHLYSWQAVRYKQTCDNFGHFVVCQKREVLFPISAFYSTDYPAVVNETGYK